MLIIPRQPGYRLPRKSKSLHILRASVVKQSSNPPKGGLTVNYTAGPFQKQGITKHPNCTRAICEHQKHARPSLIANFSFVIGYSFRNDPSDMRCILSTYLGVSMFKVTTPSLGCVVSTGGGAPTRKKQKKVLIFFVSYFFCKKKTQLK